MLLLFLKRAIGSIPSKQHITVKSWTYKRETCQYCKIYFIYVLWDSGWLFIKLAFMIRGSKLKVEKFFPCRKISAIKLGCVTVKATKSLLCPLPWMIGAKGTHYGCTGTWLSFSVFPIYVSLFQVWTCINSQPDSRDSAQKCRVEASGLTCTFAQTKQTKWECVSPQFATSFKCSCLPQF